MNERVPYALVTLPNKNQAIDANKHTFQKPHPKKSNQFMTAM